MDRHDWDRRYSGDDLVWSATPNQFLEAEAAGLEPGRALDLACGEGRNALWLAGRGWRVTAVDFSEAGMATGARRAADADLTVEWVVADVVEWEPEPDGFDLVVVCYLQLPGADLARVLGHAVRGLAPGATLVAVGHDLANLADGYGGPQDPSVLWTVDALIDALDGLTIEVAACVERRVDTDSGERVALDTLVRARRAGGARR